jgi:two-component system, chemotaxis family, response regulator Rcp1
MRRNIGRPMEILLVEDSLIDARLTIRALRRGGLQHRLTLILDGGEAMEFLLQEGRFRQAPRPDLILLDLLLPHKSGLDILEDLRSNPQLSDIPVVILTASEDQETRERVEALQVEHFLCKPVNFDRFFEMVKQLKHHWHHDLILPALD